MQEVFKSLAFRWFAGALGVMITINLLLFLLAIISAPDTQFWYLIGAGGIFSETRDKSRRSL